MAVDHISSLKATTWERAKGERTGPAGIAATFTYASDGASQIGYGTGTCGVNGIACFTRSAPNSFTRSFDNPDWTITLSTSFPAAIASITARVP